ncbi:MAG TPA: hypothetical protein PK280_01370 [Planctomycetota bacterium]|nr:hypothetical protein [Planctomycetota bacterium]
MTTSSPTPRTYVGFGFGAIQAGLFLYEAFRSGKFTRLVVAEVVPDVVNAVREAGGFFIVNIAHPDRVESAKVGPVEIYNPADAADREKLVAALAEAAEIGTAVPSVDCYRSPGPGSLHKVLAAGLGRKAETSGARSVVYAAENHNRAAEILEGLVMPEIPAARHGAVHWRARFLNTVIGKMSGLVGGDAGLPPVTPGGSRAFLVEAFNRILITQVEFPDQVPFERGLSVFEEKPDLLPFEEAKLFGHNATHALAAYLAMLAGVEKIAGLRELPGAMDFLRGAFVNESGAALVAKYAGADPLFTKAGYAAYADDLLARMTNPHLMDSAERVGRDVKRKLAWDDRFIGTMRECLAQRLGPRRYAIGAAAAFAALDRATLASGPALAKAARELWAGASRDVFQERQVLELLESGRAFLAAWLAAGKPNLEAHFAAPGVQR